MKEQQNWCVYMHTSPSGKRYIGITGKPVNERWRNGNGYTRHPYFWQAIQKYGWTSFCHDVLFANLTKKEAERLEQICIMLFRSNNRKYGYNCSTGGECGSVGSKRTAEQLKKMSDANKGKRLTEEHKHKLSLAHKGKKVSISESVRAKRSQAFSFGNNPQAKQVYCFETDTIYQSGSEAASKLNLNVESSNVCRCCRGETKSCEGYHFCFADDILETKFEEKLVNNKHVKVLCLETQTVYHSIAEASREVLNDKNASGIVRNCQGKQKECCGYHFQYV